VVVLTVEAGASGDTRPSSFKAHTVVLGAGALLASAVALVSHTHLLTHLKSRPDVYSLDLNLYWYNYLTNSFLFLTYGRFANWFYCRFDKLSGEWKCYVTLFNFLDFR
jgi:hypothetical protein